MRKVNAIVSASMLVCFVLHAVLGVLTMAGATNDASRILGWITFALMGIHVVIGFILTTQTLVACKRSGTHYFRGNELFWARRLSGLLILVLMAFHIGAFSTTASGVIRLEVFTAARLATQILLVLSIALHVVINVKPLLLSFGVKRLVPFAGDILVVLCLILLLAVTGFIIYYLRWLA